MKHSRPISFFTNFWLFRKKKTKLFLSLFCFFCFFFSLFHQLEVYNLGQKYGIDFKVLLF